MNIILISSQIVFQCIAKKDIHYALVTFKVRFPKIANDKVKDKDHIIFVIDLEQLDSNSRWRGQAQILYKELAEKITSFKFDFKEFMLNAGFTNWQRKFLSLFVKSCITVKDSQLHIQMQYKPQTQVLVTEKFDTLSNPQSVIFELVEHFGLSFAPYYSLREIVDTIYNQQNMLREEKDLADHIHELKTAHTTIHSPHQYFEETINAYKYTDAEYGNPGNFLDKINMVGLSMTMKYYNTFKIIQANRYYIILGRQYEKILIRLDLIETKHIASMRIGVYHFGSNIIDFLDLDDTRTQERLINILQMTEDQIKESALNKIFDYQKTLLGKKLCLQEKAGIERYNKKIDITPNKIAQILLTNSDETLPKYKLDIQKHFTKGFITNLGHCYISVKTYFIKSLYKFDNIFCIRFEIAPFHSKTKIYKFLINSKDIKLQLNIDYPLENPYRNWDTIVTIIDNLVLKKKMVYNSIELPLLNPSYKVIPIRNYNLKNIITQSIESSIQTNSTIFGNFLHRKIQENKIILQTTKKINNTFIIITIEKHIILDYWTFVLYIPKSCRRFITSIYSSDINTFNSHFLESLYSVSATKLDANKKNFYDYSKFSDEYQKVSNTVGTFKPKSFQRKESLSDGELNEIIFQEREKKKKSQRDADDYEEIKRKFIEIKFWENIIRHTNIEKTKSNNYILYLDNFRGILREFVHDEIVQTSADDEALIEIFLENTHKKYEMFTGIPQIPDIYVENHDLLLRITSLSRMNSYNNRFRLDQIIKLYNEDNLANKLQLFNTQRKLSLARVRLLAEYMIYKIKNWRLVPITKEDVEKPKPLNKETLLPWANYSLKLNCNFDIQERIDDKHLFIDKVLIFRGVLTTNPLQMVSFVYNERKDDIWVYIYDINGSWSIRKVIRMDDVIANVPYARTMLEKKLHKQVGEKMFRAFKNSLIIHSFLYQKKVIH